MKYICGLFFGGLLLLFSYIELLGAGSGLSTQEMQEKSQSDYRYYLNIKKSHIEPVEVRLQCFDVNEAGEIAIGGARYEKCYISVYNANAEFMYSFSFNCAGFFGIEWVGDGICIYLTKEGAAAFIDINGKVGEVRKTENTMENNDYERHVIFAKKKQVNGITYQMKNDLGILNYFATSYSKVISIDPNGKELVIYDAGGSYAFIIIVSIIGVAIFVSIVFTNLVKSLKNKPLIE